MRVRIHQHIHRAKAVLCIILVSYVQVWLSGCGSFDAGAVSAPAAPDSGWIRIDLTPEHPLTAALAGSTFAGAKAIEVEPTVRLFRLVYADGVREISGGFEETSDGPAVSALSFGVRTSRVDMKIAAASSQVTTIRTSDGHQWRPNTVASSRAIDRDGKSLQSLLDANTELMEDARQIDSAGLLQMGHGPNLPSGPGGSVVGGPKPGSAFLIETLFVMSLIVNLWWVAPLAVQSLIAVFTTVVAINIVLGFLRSSPGGSGNSAGAGGNNNGSPDNNGAGQTSAVIAPLIAAIDHQTFVAGASYTGPTPALSAGTSPITWSLVQGPAGMTIDPVTGKLAWTVPIVGQYPLIIRATNEAGFDEEDWNLTVALNLGWSDVGSGVRLGSSPGTIYSMGVFDDDGDGPIAPALYVGGEFDKAGGAAAQNIGRWNGSSWSTLSGGITGSPFISIIAYAITVFDEDGAGPNPPALFVGGSFTNAGGNVTNGIARWDGTAWSAVGGGMTNSQGDAVVTSLCVFDDDGAGPHASALYAAGIFDAAGGVPAFNIAKWDGAQWSALGIGLEGANFFPFTVLRTAVFDSDGAGPNLPVLYVGGDLSKAGGVDVNGIAQWNGVNWSNVGAGLTFPSFVTGMAVFDQDHGGPQLPQLFLGGFFSSAGGVPVSNLARYDGAAYATVGDNLAASQIPGVDSLLLAMAVFDADDAGPGAPDLYVGGLFLNAGSVEAHHVAQWNGSNWSALGTGLGDSYSELVNSFAVFDDDGPGGPHLASLYTGGLFVTADGVAVSCLAKWGAVP